MYPFGAIVWWHFQRALIPSVVSFSATLTAGHWRKRCEKRVLNVAQEKRRLQVCIRKRLSFPTDNCSLPSLLCEV